MAMPYKDGTNIYIPASVIEDKRITARALVLYCHIVNGAPVGDQWVCTDDELREFGFTKWRMQVAVASLVDAGLVAATRGQGRYTLQIVDREG